MGARARRTAARIACPIGADVSTTSTAGLRFRWTPSVALSAAAGVCALGLLAYGGQRVYRLDRSEVDYEGPARSLRQRQAEPTATRISVRLAETRLAAHQRAVFELCSGSGFAQPPFEDAFDLAVIQLEQRRLMLRVPLDGAHLARAQHNRTAGCLLIGSGLLEHGGTYTVEAVFKERVRFEPVLDVPLRVRVLAQTPLIAADRVLVLAMGLLLMAAVALLLRAAAVADTQDNSSAHDLAPAALDAHPIAPLLASLLIFAASELSVSGPSWTLVKGFGLVALQVGLAVWLARARNPGPALARRLAVRRPIRRGATLLSAVGAWPALVGSSLLALKLVPHTGQAPIETFISWPSGMLAAALLGLSLPLGEELFFRGYLYAALLRYGRPVAATLNVIVFTSLHAVQSWGNWGGLVGVFLAGFVFLALRMISGSILVSTLLHVAYNLTLSTASLSGVDAG
jgi:membrane protease YdiL (CAAX protease family)